MCKLSIYFDTRQKNKSGECSVYLRLAIKKQQKYYCITSVNPTFWKGGANPVKRGDVNYLKKNILIESKYNLAQSIVLDYAIKGVPLDSLAFEKAYISEQTNTASFYDFIQQLIDTEISKRFAAGTTHVYKTQLSKLKKFRSEVLFTDIDAVFIRSYEAYMYSELGNKKSTANKSLIWLKNVLNKAIEKSLITENPFTKNGIRLQRIKGNRIALSLGEVDRLVTLFRAETLPKGKQNVLRYFLFCCYTGMRFGDLRTLKFSDIKRFDDIDFVSIIMHKTEEPVNIPLVDKAKELIDKVNYPNATVFDVYTDQSVNRYLKDIMLEANIDKSISFHCSRHTFATVGFNRLKIPIEVISKILGHTDIKTTMIYCKIDNEKLNEEAKKWDTA